MTAGMHVIDEGLEHWIKEVYLLVLGLGFAFIVQDLTANLETPVLAGAQFLYFAGIYYFLSYDWMAYTALIDRYPYGVADDPSLRYQGRFYADMSHLFIKAVLVFLALRPLDFGTVALAAGLFAAWHLTIVVWHAFARYEHDDYTVPWWSHVAMAVVYCSLVGAFALADPHLAQPRESLVFVAVLVTVAAGYATVRKRTLVAELG